MPELTGSQTAENLRAAFASESEASRRYLYFAQQADVDGYPEVAALFRSAADGATGHAIGHLDVLVAVGDPPTGAPIGSTEDNLAAALASERAEAEKMYPGFAAEARQEGHHEVADWLESLAAGSVADRFAEALMGLQTPPGH